MRCMGLRLALAFSYMMLALRAIQSVLLPLLLLCTIEAYTLNTNENVCIRSIGVQGTYQKEVTNLNG